MFKNTNDLSFTKHIFQQTAANPEEQHRVQLTEHPPPKKRKKHEETFRVETF